MALKQKNYTISELIRDQSFRRMVSGEASPAEIEAWSSWIEESDQNRSKARAAMGEIAGYTFKDPVLPDLEKKWMRLYAKTAGREEKRTFHHQRRGSEGGLRWMIRIAAAVMVVSLAGLWVYHFEEDQSAITHLEQLTEEKVVATGEGEQKTLQFSNNSRVTLNSNTTLTYRLGVLRNQTIDVTLEGEAWFDVESDPEKKEPVFAVRTTDGVIRDIGTKFLVTVKQKQSRVVLQEGFVEVEPFHATRDGIEANAEVFRVEKGEMVEFNRDNILTRSKVNPTFYSSWATGFMELNHTGLREFARYVEERFDVLVQINDEHLEDISLDGAVYFRSLEELVRSVSEVTGVPVYRSEDRSRVLIGRPE